MMVFFLSYNPTRTHSFAARLATHGVVVAQIDFVRGREKPFPAGLEECFAGVVWLEANKARLSISGQVLFGDSGGG